MPDLEPRTIDGKARRVLRYPPMFFWYVPVVAIVWIGLLLHLSGYNWRMALGFGVPFLLIGVVLGVRFRDVK